jgi:hypothetical protein
MEAWWLQNSVFPLFSQLVYTAYQILGPPGNSDCQLANKITIVPMSPLTLITPGFYRGVKGCPEAGLMICPKAAAQVRDFTGFRCCIHKRIGSTI